MTKRNGSKSGLSRRQALTTIAGAGAALTFGMRAPAALAQSRAPIKIGALNSYSKVFATEGNDNFIGMQMYFDQIGWEVAGRKIELMKEDDELNPQIGLQKMRKLVESDKVDFVCGVQASNVAMALLDYTQQSKTLLIVSGAAAEGITRRRLPYVFRTSLATSQESVPTGNWIYDNLTKEVLVTASDYAGGRDVIDTFKVGFQKRNGKIIKEIYPPLGTNDFSAYLTEMNKINPPAIYAFFAGSDAIRFIKQYEEYGLKGKIKLTGYGSLTDGEALRAVGRSAVGIIAANMYVPSLDTPENKAFLAAYAKKHKGIPTHYVDFGFTTARLIVEGLKATQGDTSDKDKLSKAMAAAKFVDPRGPVSFHPQSHNIIQDIYILETVETNGTIENKVLETAKAVGALSD
ncbi:MAG: ABC transporter substrate-binding protein [Bradyrhizobiaceae bacterium]|nr:ABC transporter substrate-binding protein [Bradyrhizobiaceae bacterium]